MREMMYVRLCVGVGVRIREKIRNGQEQEVKESDEFKK